MVQYIHMVVQALIPELSHHLGGSSARQPPPLFSLPPALAPPDPCSPILVLSRPWTRLPWLRLPLGFTWWRVSVRHPPWPCKTMQPRGTHG